MPEFLDRTGGVDDDPWLTVQQVSEELSIHPATVRVWIRHGRLRAVRAGRGFRVRRSEVERALRADAPEAVQQVASVSAARPVLAAPNVAPRQIADQIISVPPAMGREP
jgi:excisionase family DNA binding protein